MSKTQQVQNQQRFVREESRQMLPGANDHPSNPNFGGPLHDLAQQCIGTLPILQWSQIIRLVEVYRADTLCIDKVENIDGLCRFDVGLDEIIIGERDVLSLFVFVTLDNFIPRYFPAGFLIDSSISNPREITPVEQVEIYGAIGFSRIEGDRKIDQPEINGAFPNRAASRFRLGRRFWFLVIRFFTRHGFFSYSMDFWFMVVQALSLRCFTMTIRPRVAFASPKPRALPRLLFRRLRVMEAPAGISC